MSSRPIAARERSPRSRVPRAPRFDATPFSLGWDGASHRVQWVNQPSRLQKWLRGRRDVYFDAEWSSGHRGVGVLQLCGAEGGVIVVDCVRRGRIWSVLRAATGLRLIGFATGNDAKRLAVEGVRVPILDIASFSMKLACVRRSSASRGTNRSTRWLTIWRRRAWPSGVASPRRSAPRARSPSGAPTRRSSARRRWSTRRATPWPCGRSSLG